MDLFHSYACISIHLTPSLFAGLNWFELRLRLHNALQFVSLVISRLQPLSPSVSRLSWEWSFFPNVLLLQYFFSWSMSMFCQFCHVFTENALSGRKHPMHFKRDDWNLLLGMCSDSYRFSTFTRSSATVAIYRVLLLLLPILKEHTSNIKTRAALSQTTAHFSLQNAKASEIQ